jgi:sec-independent protein translocase protein TatA
MRDGLDRILRKVGEECAETLLAAKNAERNPAAREQLIRETCGSLVPLPGDAGLAGVFLGRGRSRARTALRAVGTLGKGCAHSAINHPCAEDARNREESMGRFGIGELLLILAIVVLLFGTKRLGSLGSDLGNAIRGFRKAMTPTEEDKSDKPRVTEQPRTAR